MRRTISYMTVCLLALTACEHKDLCYDHPHDKEIRINFDWSETRPENIPQVMRVVFHIPNDDPDVEYDLPPSGGIVKVPDGVYEILTYDNDNVSAEWDNANDGNIETTIFHTPKWKAIPQSGEIYVAPEHFCSDILPQMVLSDNPGNRSITLVPERKVSLVTYEIHGIRKLERADAIYGTLSGVSTEFALAEECCVESRVEGEEHTIGFEADITDGEITGKFYVLGCGFTLHEVEEHENEHIFTVYIVNKQGKYISIPVDVTEQLSCERSYGKVVDRHLVINLDTEVPDKGNEGGTGSFFDPDVDEWEDVEEDIPV